MGLSKSVGWISSIATACLLVATVVKQRWI
jgi:hypothetical protein